MSEDLRVHRLQNFLAWIVVGCSVLVVLGSCDYRTTRVWPANTNGVNDGSTMTEGAGQWAAWTFLIGLLIVGILVAWAYFEWRRAVLGVFAATAFTTATLIAGRHWFDLLDERELDRVYALHIASGLPIVTVAGIVGSVLVVLLMAIGLWINRRTSR